MLAGSTAAGGVDLNPSSVLDQGIAVVGQLAGTLGFWGTWTSPVNLAISLFTMLTVILCFALIAGLLLVTLVSAYLVTGGGVLLLGFGGSQFTRSITERYLSYALATGVQLFVLLLLVSVGQNLAQGWVQNLLDRAGFDITVYLEIAGGSIVFSFSSGAFPSSPPTCCTGVFPSPCTRASAWRQPPFLRA
jgi:type IV secretion system protein TrbL